VCVWGCRLPVLSNWQSLVPCLTTEITEGLPQVEIQELATLTACCVEAAVAAEAQAGNADEAVATGVRTSREQTVIIASPFLHLEWAATGSAAQHLVLLSPLSPPVIP
jgi:hypothetical protein